MIQVPEQLLMEVQRIAINLEIQYSVIAIGQIAPQSDPAENVESNSNESKE